jgi:hypothetical protein
LLVSGAVTSVFDKSPVSPRDVQSSDIFNMFDSKYYVRIVSVK